MSDCTVCGVQIVRQHMPRHMAAKHGVPRTRSQQGAKNQREGTRLERAARKDYEARGWFVVRAGGSKGLADLVAICGVYEDLAGGISAVMPTVELIQCKLDGYLPPAERRSLVDLSTKLGAVPVVAFWSKDGRAARTVAFKEA